MKARRAYSSSNLESFDSPFDFAQGSLRTPFDARQAVLQPQMACHEQAGKALARKLSPRVEW